MFFPESEYEIFLDNHSHPQELLIYIVIKLLSPILIKIELRQ